MLEVLRLSPGIPLIFTARKGNSVGGSYLPHFNVDEAANGIVRDVPEYVVRHKVGAREDIHSCLLFKQWVVLPRTSIQNPSSALHHD
jgi:hypothetical protein